VSPFQIREDKHLGANRVRLPCALHTIERYAFKMNRQFS